MPKKHSQKVDIQREATPAKSHLYFNKEEVCAPEPPGVQS